MQQTTIQRVRIAWARTDREQRRAVGRGVITTLAADLAPGAEVRVTQRCVLCGGPHGRPLLTDAELVASIAYAPGWVVVAVAHRDDAAAIGIDAELAAAMPDVAALFAPHDPPDLRRWTEIEAVLKADGRGLLLPPAGVTFPGRGQARVPDGGAYRLHPIHADPDILVTLARAVSP